MKNMENTRLHFPTNIFEGYREKQLYVSKIRENKEGKN